MNAIATPVAAPAVVLPAIDARIEKLQALVGQEIEGVATQLAPYGVFLDVGAAVGEKIKEIGLLHLNSMSKGAAARLATIAAGDLIKVTITLVERDELRRNKLRIHLSEIALPVNRLKSLAGSATRVSGTITRRLDDYLEVELAHGVIARLPITKLGGTSLDALKKGVTVKASVLSVEGLLVTLTREGIDSAHERARRDAHRAENRLLDQQYRSSKKSSGNGKSSGGGKKKK